jgi:hypothetical protein
MVRLHRRLLADAGPGPAVLLDTPFGFQANADDLVEKTLTYFSESVGRDVQVAPWRSRNASTVEQERALALIQSAVWAFAGPGSPTYALRQWTGTPVPAALADVATRGGTLCLGSAAAVLTGTHAIPVYEIYKAGADPHWLEGIDVLGALTGIRAAVVPHYDNNEGGHYDTRYCYLGEDRLVGLEADLPEGTGVLGVDEHTALILDLAAGTAEVSGSGVVTARVRGASTPLPDGTVVSIEDLAAMLRGEGTGQGSAAARTTAPVSTDNAAPSTDASLRTVADSARERFDTALVARDSDGAVAAVLDLEQALRDWSADTQQGDDDYARRVLRAMVVGLGGAAATGVRDPREVVGPFVDALLKVRADARAAKDFATSDLVRDTLAGAGVEVRDTPDGATWHLPD